MYVRTLITVQSHLIISPSLNPFQEANAPLKMCGRTITFYERCRHADDAEWECGRLDHFGQPFRETRVNRNMICHECDRIRDKDENWLLNEFQLYAHLVPPRRAEMGPALNPRGNDPVARQYPTQLIAGEDRGKLMNGVMSSEWLIQRRGMNLRAMVGYRVARMMVDRDQNVTQAIWDALTLNQRHNIQRWERQRREARQQQQQGGQGQGQGRVGGRGRGGAGGGGPAGAGRGRGN